MTKRTAIKGGWVVGWGKKGHEMLEGGCVVTEGDRIVFVGFPDDPECPKADNTIDARGKIVLPGLINIHCVANIDMQVLGIDGQASGGGYNRPASTIDPSTPHIFTDEEFRTSADFSVATILKSGAASFGSVVTGATKKWEDEAPEMHALAEACEKLGARAWLAHTYQETSDYTEPDGTHRIVWDRKKADQGLQHAIEFIKYLKGRADGRINGFLFPKRTERCSDDLLKETLRQSKGLGGVHVRTHFAHSLQEQRNFKAKPENSNRTMVEWLRDIGFLGPQICLTHSIFIAGHSATGEEAGEDLEILAHSKTNVCHCPVVYARSGVFMESFSRYVAAGINMSLGTDTFPTDLLEEMRVGSLVCKVVDRKRESGLVKEFFDAVTVNPAKALRREDIGRLAVGCKADVSIFNLPVMDAGPVDDPMRNLVHHANRLNCDTVMVDGKVVVKDGHVAGLDEEELAHKTQKLWGKYKSALVGWDYKKRRAEEVFPPTLPVRRGQGR